jgi:hypothetical protein
LNCPKCKSKNVCEIIYGYVNLNDEIKRQVDEKKIRLGGCVIGEYNPQFNCNKCSYEWGNVDD